MNQCCEKTVLVVLEGQAALQRHGLAPYIPLTDRPVPFFAVVATGETQHRYMFETQGDLLAWAAACPDQTLKMLGHGLRRPRGEHFYEDYVLSDRYYLREIWERRRQGLSTPLTREIAEDLGRTPHAIDDQLYEYTCRRAAGPGFVSQPEKRCS